jgi:hypothetical protein
MVPPFYGSGPCGHSFTSLAPIERSARSFRRDLRFDDAMDLMAIYAAGNKAGRPVGSGWYVVGLNAGQCGMAKAGTFGCKFEASGNHTECGAAVVNEKTGELDVVVAKN